MNSCLFSLLLLCCCGGNSGCGNNYGGSCGNSHKHYGCTGNFNGYKCTCYENGNNCYTCNCYKDCCCEAMEAAAQCAAVTDCNKKACICNNNYNKCCNNTIPAYPGYGSTIGCGCDD
ncbi:MAG: hypothetical protein IJ291_07565 [Lachnospiraceae bacterium]|nr:hypothetical protein [Lachnospiraceae bacterium]